MSTVTALRIFWKHLKFPIRSYWKYAVSFILGSFVTGMTGYFIYVQTQINYKNNIAIRPQTASVAFIAHNNIVTQQKHNEPEIKLNNATNQQRKVEQKEHLRDNHEISCTLPEIPYTEKHKPLNQWSVDEIRGKILQWILNDVQYNSDLLRTQKIFKKRELNATKLQHISSEDVKCIIKDDMLQFITPQTLNIICDYSIDVIKHGINSNSCEQIACILYNNPIRKLLNKIAEQKLDGKAMIEVLKNETNDMIQNACGWNQDEVEQIKLLLFKEMILTELEFKHRISIKCNNNVKHILNEIMKSIDIEQIQYNIKNNHDTSEFSEMIRDLIDECNTNISIHEIYTNIAQCFVYEEADLAHWICCNCGNRNFNEHPYSGKSIFYCTLCGIPQVDCVIRKIRNKDTFIAAYNAGRTANNRPDDEDRERLLTKDVETLLNDVIAEQNIDISCRNRKDDERCPSMWRLAHCLIQYKQWIDRMQNDSDSLEQTTFIDITCIDKQQFHNIFKRCLYSDTITQIIHTAFDLNLVMQVFEKNVENMFNVQTFLSAKRKDFVQKLRKYAGVHHKWGIQFYNILKKDITDDMVHNTFKDIFTKCAQFINEKVKERYDRKQLIEIFQKRFTDIHAFKNIDKQSFVNLMKKQANVTTILSALLYTNIRSELAHTAQQQQLNHLNAFMCKLDMKAVDEDYRHILDIHIQKGDKTSITNVFMFFNHIAHWKEDAMTIKACKSLKRRYDRMQKMAMNYDKEIVAKKVMESEYMMTLHLYYIQSELDVMHSYLAHSEWKQMVKHFTLQNYIESTQQEKENKEEWKVEEEKVENTNHKYVTDYLFGVIHEHHRLTPIWHSIYDEMMHNQKCNLNENVWRQSLVKAIHKHQIALSVDDKDKQCISKYFSPSYHILRNENIGIRHILALLIYTDMSAICTAFRRTYRKIKEQQTDDQVTNEHRQFYHLARSIFEAVELFGDEMKPELKVYHGLNKTMHFDKFTAYFNQPVSTTLSFESARRFSCEDGIILCLTTGQNSDAYDESKPPKYLSVAWMSCYPHEEEKLFYGSHVVFKIDDIFYVKGTKWNSLSDQLSAFNKFQKLVTNQEPNFLNNDHDTKIIIPYIQYIFQQTKHVSAPVPYDHALFNHFCNQTTRIFIRNFTRLPPSLFNILFHNTPKQELSLAPILTLFPNLSEIVLKNIDINVMSRDRQCYLQMIRECIHMAPFVKYLKRISFQSNPRCDNKQNSTLKRFEAEALKVLQEYQWSVEYQFESERYHALMFINDFINIRDKILELQSKQAALEQQRNQDIKKLIELEMQLKMQRNKDTQVTNEKAMMQSSRMYIMKSNDSILCNKCGASQHLDDIISNDISPENIQRSSSLIIRGVEPTDVPLEFELGKCKPSISLSLDPHESNISMSTTPIGSDSNFCDDTIENQEIEGWKAAHLRSEKYRYRQRYLKRHKSSEELEMRQIVSKMRSIFDVTNDGKR